jgi:hypothetical protein
MTESSEPGHTSKRPVPSRAARASATDGTAMIAISFLFEPLFFILFKEGERKTLISRPLKRWLLSVLFSPFSWALFARVFR